MTRHTIPCTYWSSHINCNALLSIDDWRHLCDYKWKSACTDISACSKHSRLMFNRTFFMWVGPGFMKIFLWKSLEIFCWSKFFYLTITNQRHHTTEVKTYNNILHTTVSHHSILSMSIMNIYSAESWSISTALCVLSGNAEIISSSAVVGNDHCWARGHGDYPVVSSRPLDLQ